MKIRVYNSDLIKALKIVSKLNTDAVSIDVSDGNIGLIREDNGTTIQVMLSGEIIEEGNIAIPIQVVNLLKNLKNDYLLITETEIHSGAKVIKYREDNYEPVVAVCTESDPMKEVFTTTEEELHRMLEVKYAAAEDQVRPILAGVYFNSNETCALDGYRMSVRRGEYASNASFVVNRNTVKVLDNILDTKLNRTIRVLRGKDNVKFIIGGTIEITGKIIHGEYLRYKSIIPDEYYNKATINLEKYKDDINFLSCIKSKYVKLNFVENKLAMTADQCVEEFDEAASRAKTIELQNSATLDYKEEYKKWVAKKNKAEKENRKFNTKCPKEKNIRSQKVYKLVPTSNISIDIDCLTEFKFDTEFNIAVNSKYLVEAIKNYSDKVEFRMSSTVGPVVITNDGENLELVLPIRILE